MSSVDTKTSDQGTFNKKGVCCVLMKCSFFLTEYKMSCACCCSFPGCVDLLPAKLNDLIITVTDILN